MKKCIYLVAIALCFIGCQNEEQGNATTHEVLSEFISETETTFAEELTQIEGMNSIEVYYPDENGNLVNVEMEIDETNLIKSLETIFKDSKNDLLQPLMPHEANIKDIKVNKSENACYIDFDDAFVTHMNLGSGAEEAVITGIVDTLGKYYDVQYVEITVNGSTFETGHNLYEGKMAVSQS